MVALTMMEQSTDVNRFRCKPIGRHKCARAGRVPARVAINNAVLEVSAATAAAAALVSRKKLTSGRILKRQRMLFLANS